MIFRKYLCPVVFCVFFFSFQPSETNAQQQRDRVIENPPANQTENPRTNQTENQRTNPTQVVRPTSSRPVNPAPTVNRPSLTNEIVVVPDEQKSQPLVKKTGSSNPTNAGAANNAKSKFLYNATASSMMMRSIQSKMGLRYRYGSTGPNTYDCSGFVWSVFNEAGFLFERSSAKTYWETFEPVYGDERFKFGTLVFFNRLGHVGIVVDENGFYHASTSKGITYSPFAGYWEKRIVGYRRIPFSYLLKTAVPDPTPSEK